MSLAVVESCVLPSGSDQLDWLDLASLAPGNVVQIDAAFAGYRLTVPEVMSHSDHKVWWLPVLTDDLRIKHHRVAVSRVVSPANQVIIDGYVVVPSRFYLM